MHLETKEAFQQFNEQQMGRNKRFQSHLQSPRLPIGLRSIPTAVLDRLVHFYMESLQHTYPIIPQEWLTRIFRSISETRSGLQLSHLESFVAYITLAISSASLYWKAGPQARAGSLSLFSSAIRRLQEIVEIGGLERLQAVLLLAHYAHLNPEFVDIWTCVTTATKIVVDLGLHATVDGEDNDLRQRLFWVAYNMDRSLSVTLKLPISFPEESISIKVYPSPLVLPFESQLIAFSI
ncbi:hypothetical protein N7493_006762 [Penicillium malachiteum]|uniref:Xylanolytic transcriptional activator regulatory domain-containing protein n=1 Tax=Penicillium malachiteum TaxID=1324776 RepID=A0AAD6HJK3_9EURO|nr:hypothetical protein N7493_006762 [Penicillium malachiteum]